MKRTTSIISFFCMLGLMVACVYAATVPVRLKDIAHILEARDNQLIGYGLVVGLKNTGDSTQTEFTKQALTNLLSRMGIAPMEKEFKSKNIASVMVTAKLPAFVNAGQKIDVTVSSLGNATSLQGGTLLMTQLQGADDNVYAVAQGQVAMGFSAIEGSQPVDASKRQTNVGRITNGAIVERDVPVSLADDFITIVIDKPDYTTASRVVTSIKEAGITARARDAATIIISKEASLDMVGFISLIENLNVIPDTVARIVINEQTGAIVMGENVRVSPVAVLYNDISIVVAAKTTKVTLEAEKENITTVSELISALNAVGLRPKDLIAILQSIKAAGAISADIEVI